MGAPVLAEPNHSVPVAVRSAGGHAAQGIAATGIVGGFAPKRTKEGYEKQKNGDSSNRGYDGLNHLIHPFPDEPRSRCRGLQWQEEARIG
jgi:hypothetical protein